MSSSSSAAISSDVTFAFRNHTPAPKYSTHWVAVSDTSSTACCACSRCWRLHVPFVPDDVANRAWATMWHTRSCTYRTATHYTGTGRRSRLFVLSSHGRYHPTYKRTRSWRLWLSSSSHRNCCIVPVRRRGRADNMSCQFCVSAEPPDGSRADSGESGVFFLGVVRVCISSQSPSGKHYVWLRTCRL